MGLFDKIRSQFIDVIEWTDDSSDTLVWKFPRTDDEIKNGAQLIVRESQAAVFMNEGELGDVFDPGRHVLETSNLPILTTLASWKYAFDAPFKCDVFYVTTRQFTDLKWGTQNPIMMRDPEFGPVRLRAFGSYCIQVTDPGTFIKQIAGTNSLYQTDEITGQFRNMLVSRFADALGEAKVPMLDLAANYNELGDALRANLQADFDPYGVTLTKFLIENISLPPQVEEALDKRSEMGLVGNLNAYTQFQTANAIEDMANNPGGGGNMMGVIAGVGMGNTMGGAMQGAAQAPQQPGAMPPPLPQQAQWYAAVGGQQTGPFDPAALQQQIQQGRIATDTLVWKQGMASWTAAAQVPELAGLFGSMPPPLPTP
ncbi:MAG: SPFH domain-containing protein [Lentisphaerae bacterium]|mgnify:FL=1|jgi:membrane protease subunit (stomatin/prohibitin family)|nr:SPFH domain-containing protein [Lentisphaerota bacterium]MBT4821429.1 SPFH domain-containing protein [Lentisphaerota bacterium]MBT5607901.1 SPFH domain-containing protein [Lentisphaerota bacterium]MBT7062072.1 SPFH domain-containing protein [Lentisphaerota bacterium]MBT7848623.1 SPFH domain-containing protein [Lentisphaerota bacterium]